MAFLLPSLGAGLVSSGFGQLGQLELQMILDERAGTLDIIGAHLLIATLLDSERPVKLVVLGTALAEEGGEIGVVAVDRVLHLGAAFRCLAQLGAEILAELRVETLLR